MAGDTCQHCPRWRADALLRTAERDEARRLLATVEARAKAALAGRLRADVERIYEEEAPTMTPTERALARRFADAFVALAKETSAALDGRAGELEESRSGDARPRCACHDDLPPDDKGRCQTCLLPKCRAPAAASKGAQRP